MKERKHYSCYVSYISECNRRYIACLIEQKEMENLKELTKVRNKLKGLFKMRKIKKKKNKIKNESLVSYEEALAHHIWYLVD